MAQTQPTGANRKNRPAATRFYLVKTVQQTRSRVADKLDDYNQTYIARPLKNGRTWATKLKAAPRKTLSAWLDEGKTTITELNKESRSAMGGMIKDSRSFLTRAGKDPRQTLTDLVDDGRSMVKDLQTDTRERMDALKADTRSVLTGIGKDARLVVDEVVSGSRQALDRLPAKRKIEKEVRSRIRTLPARLNLPSRRDVQRLARQVSQLNEKVAALHRTTAR